MSFCGNSWRHNPLLFRGKLLEQNIILNDPWGEHPIEKNEAARIAWNTLGVWSVDNELVIDWN